MYPPPDGPTPGYPGAAPRYVTLRMPRATPVVTYVLLGITIAIFLVHALLSPAVPRAQQVLKFTNRFMAASRNTLTAYDASEGALYVLFAAILCLSPSSPSVLAIDNLDSALNPRLVTRLVARLAEWLRAGDPDRQLLFTAHNPTVLDGLDLDDDEVRLFVVERNSQGYNTLRRVEVSPELRALNKEYPLSRLWAMGNLGAVPNV